MPVISTNQDDGYSVSGDLVSVTVLANVGIAGGFGTQYNSDTISNAGAISGVNIAVGLNGTNDVFVNLQSGSIIGGYDGTFGAGVFLNGSHAKVINFGTIAAGANGIVDESEVSGSSVFVNYGTISANEGLQINAPGDLIENSGTIDGSSGIAIAMGNNFLNGTNLTVTNIGVIEGNIDFLGTGNIFQGVGGTVRGNIVGSAGADYFDVGSQHITGTITGGGGSDTIAFASAAGAFAIDLGDGTAYGAGEAFTFSGIENATGSAYADTINGDDNVNSINGGAGNDVINGNGGADVINAGAGADTVMAGPGNDIVNGNGGNDILYGNGGADVIAGGGGADTLTGGAGNDTFVYSLVTDSPTTGPDLITDFTHGADKIDLTALHLANAGDVKITSSGGLTYITIDANNDGTADMQINLTGTNVLTASDIVGIPAAAAPAHAATAHVAMTTVTHHDLATSLHAVAVDHGLYG